MKFEPGTGGCLMFFTASRTRATCSQASLHTHGGKPVSGSDHDGEQNYNIIGVATDISFQAILAVKCGVVIMDSQ